MKRLPVLTSFLLFVALCVSAAYWAMQLYKPPTRAVFVPPEASVPELRLEAATGLFGGRASTVVASNYQLKGLVDASHSMESVAILSADGKAAQVYKVGAEVGPGVIVKEVHPKYIVLSDAGILKRVELPDLETVPANNAPPVPFPTPIVSIAPPPIQPQPLPPENLPPNLQPNQAQNLQQKAADMARIGR